MSEARNGTGELTLGWRWSRERAAGWAAPPGFVLTEAIITPIEEGLP